MPFVPAEHHGKLVIFAMLAHAGELEAGERAIAPFRSLAAPIVDMVQPQPYSGMYPPEDPSYHPVGVTRTLFVDSVDPLATRTIIEYLERSNAPMRVAQIRVLGGAMSRVPVDATAFAHRNRRILVNVAALYERPDEAATHEAWATDFAAALQRGEVGAYVNFVGDEGDARIHDIYPAPTLDRLAAIKRRYDPANLFRLNQNVPPAVEPVARA
jgi:FAD/FMN-containing dehydrogenase